MSSPSGEAVDSGRSLPRAGAVAAIVAGFLLALTLVYQQLDVYFTFGETVVPTHAEETRYVWTAGLGLSAMVLGLVLALVSGSGRLAWCGAAGIIVTLVVAGVFAVPHDRWHPDPPTYERPSNYTPCYSGSEDCGAGG